MTSSSISEASQKPLAKTSAANQAARGRAALAFNPLHPSMELPPEQLIRLLSITCKKTRKHPKKHQVTVAHASDWESAALFSTGQTTPPQPATAQSVQSRDAARKTVTSSRHHSPRIAGEHGTGTHQTHEQTHDSAQRTQARETDRVTLKESSAKRERTAQHAADEQRDQISVVEELTAATRQHAAKVDAVEDTIALKSMRAPRRTRRPQRQRVKLATSDRTGPGLLLLALLIGVFTGAAISGYFFWYQKTSSHQESNTVPQESVKPRHRQMSAQQPIRPTKRKALDVDSRRTTPLPTPTPAAAKAARSSSDRQWKSATEQERERLRERAEQRLAERLTTLEVTRELADLQARPAHEPKAETAPQRPPATPSAITQTALQDVAPNDRGGATVAPSASTESLDETTAQQTATTREESVQSEAVAVKEARYRSSDAAEASDLNDTISDARPATGSHADNQLEIQQMMSGAVDEPSVEAAEHSGSL